MFAVKLHLMSFYISICSEDLFAGVCSTSSHVTSHKKTICINIRIKLVGGGSVINWAYLV